VRLHRLLIIDGHKSYNLLDFQQIYKDSKIITLYMPPYSSHLLQLLDVGCFSPLKRAYGAEINALIRAYIHYVDKQSFLLAFKVAFERAFLESNIKASFKGAGLVLFNLEVVISKLNIKLRTPSLPIIEYDPWESKTPSNMRELEA
jgi:DDE superfamily endonuclease